MLDHTDYIYYTIYILYNIYSGCQALRSVLCVELEEEFLVFVARYFIAQGRLV